MRLILHIVPRADWDAADAALRPASLAREGFVHCSWPRQLLGPANALFRGRSGLVLLCIDADRLGSEVREEDCYDEGQRYPHVYGPIDRAAVIAVVDFPPGPDGAFAIPAEVARLAAPGAS